MRKHVQVVDVGAAKLVTFGPDSNLWEPSGRPMLTELSGTFVRLRPPKGVSEQVLAEVQSSLRGIAAAVKLERPREDAAVKLEVSAPATESARQAVLAMVEESHLDRDVYYPELRELCERLLAEEGL